VSEQRRVITPEYECQSRSAPFVGTWRWNGTACMIDYPANFPKRPPPRAVGRTYRAPPPVPASAGVARRPPTTPQLLAHQAAGRPAPVTLSLPRMALAALAVVGLGYWVLVRR
jgi:hypothetical protein